MRKDEFMELIQSDVDLGKEPTKVVFTKAEEELIAFAQAVQAGMIQFVLEGIIPSSEQAHFIIHLQDFMARLYAGENISFDGIKQSFSVNSRNGELFLGAVREAFKNGRVEHKETAATSDNTTDQFIEEAENAAPVTKVTLH